MGITSLRRLVCFSVLLVIWPAASFATDLGHTRVVVVVDTSASMREPGMDPERTSLLVTKLLADLVPGDLAVVRLLDLVADGALLPSRATGREIPCQENPNRMCGEVAPDGDWEAMARAQGFGVLERPSVGDAGFKRDLESHLDQRANNSPFVLAFRAAQGFLERPGGTTAPKTLVWLSDGRAEDPARLAQAVDDLQEGDVRVEAVVFGRGELSLADAMGLEARQVSSPSELMAAFADIFRGIVRAPFRVDHRLREMPAFEMKTNVQEAWVVVYGDPTLEQAWVSEPAGERPADDAAERWATAGAYRVAHIRDPRPGRWQVHAEGGGDAAYAVIQRSDLEPALLAPARATSGAKTLVEAIIRSGLDGERIADPHVLSESTIRLVYEQRELELRDDGEGGDAVAGDGRFSAFARFEGPEPVPVVLRMVNPVALRETTTTVDVSGALTYRGRPVVVDLGRLTAGETVCRFFTLPAERVGVASLELRSLRPPPPGHTFSMRFAAGDLAPDADALPVPADAQPELCLDTHRRAGSLEGVGAPLLALALAGTQDDDHAVPLVVRWQVIGLGFWALWGRVVIVVAAILALAILAGGFIVPRRFQRALALAMAPERADLGEQSPQPVAQWRGVGIGFYRHARAFVHADFRLSGTARGALAILEAAKRGTWVRGARGQPLYRETLDGTWESIDPRGRRTRAGDVYRIGERGPYLRVAVQGGRG